MWSGSRRNWCSGNWQRAESFHQISSPDPGSAPPSSDPGDPVQTADLHSNHNQESCHMTPQIQSVLFGCGITKGKLESHFQHISFFTQSQIRPTIQLSSSHSLFLNFVKHAHSLLCHVRNELPYLSSRCPQRAPIFEPIPSRLSVTAHLIFTFRLRVLNLILLVGTLFLASQLLLVPLQLLPLALVLAGLPAAWAVTGVHLWAAPVLNIHLDVFRFWLLRICRVDRRGGK